LLHIYVLALYAAWFKNYLQFSLVNNIIRMQTVIDTCIT
jgi:hypothetical protein